ncbi:MAG: COX15/CtaA family protein [Rickettsiaceae bacterium]|nr:COX15/CtaA family protein [Rickettsiaceae bacterium]
MNNSDNIKTNKIIAIWLAILCLSIISMISLGGYTRLTNSGLSITEWKPISGVIPPYNEQSWQEEFAKYQNSPEFLKINNDITMSEFKYIYIIEFAHRILGRIIAMILILPFIYFSCRNYFNSKELIIYLFAIMLLLAQGLMGWYMVKSGLINEPHVSHFRLSSHLLLACLLYITLIWQFFYQFPNRVVLKKTEEISRCLKLMIFANILLLVQIIFGGLVAGLKAGLVYNEFPLMDGNFIPTELYNMQINWRVFYHPVFVQFLHRITAYLILIVNIISYIKIRKLKNPNLTQAGQIMLVVTILQAIIGILTLLYVVPLYLAMFHQIGAIILLSSTLWIYYLLITNYR